jgi:hypothetical protein
MFGRVWLEMGSNRRSRFSQIPLHHLAHEPTLSPDVYVLRRSRHGTTMIPDQRIPAARACRDSSPLNLWRVAKSV